MYEDDSSILICSWNRRVSQTPRSKISLFEFPPFTIYRSFWYFKTDCIYLCSFRAKSFIKPTSELLWYCLKPPFSIYNRNEGLYVVTAETLAVYMYITCDTIVQWVALLFILKLSLPNIPFYHTTIFNKIIFLSMQLFLWIHEWHSSRVIGIGRLLHIGLGFLKFSLIWYKSDTKRFAKKLCNFIIHVRNYIQTLLEIGTIVLPLHT